jgi:hypothetical protein
MKTCVLYNLLQGCGMCMCFLHTGNDSSAEEESVHVKVFRIQYLSFLTCKYVSTRQAP